SGLPRVCSARGETVRLPLPPLSRPPAPRARRPRACHTTVAANAYFCPLHRLALVSAPHQYSRERWPWGKRRVDVLCVAVIFIQPHVPEDGGRKRQHAFDVRPIG